MRVVPLALGLALLPLPAGAQTAPPAPVTFTGGATLATDYRFRGLSRTDKGIAVQANVGVQLLSGFYAGIWGSSIGNYVAHGADAEVDLFGGYRRTIAGTTVDGGLLYYLYPGHGATASGYAEPYLSIAHTLGPLMAKVGGNVAWQQRGLGIAGERRGGAYGYGELSAGIPRTGLTVTGHVGHSFTRNAATLDQSYTDWSLAGTYAIQRLTLALAYVDTDRQAFSYPGLRNNKNIGGAGPVASIGVSF